MNRFGDYTFESLVSQKGGKKISQAYKGNL